eukprot:TRINITY_DN32117_c0_g1_i2.p1 TRINITY_DN32117_c0_g1~~TRINITY_DN32117_c0_g1_i2.p1  ORF type:complete len:1277 (+),score=264.26 TRINITY_DN32117_c0_g1_i2:69-3899(+)
MRCPRLPPARLRRWRCGAEYSHILSLAIAFFLALPCHADRDDEAKRSRREHMPRRWPHDDDSEWRHSLDADAVDEESVEGSRYAARPRPQRRKYAGRGSSLAATSSQATLRHIEGRSGGRRSRRDAAGAARAPDVRAADAEDANDAQLYRHLKSILYQKGGEELADRAEQLVEEAAAERREAEEEAKRAAAADEDHRPNYVNSTALQEQHEDAADSAAAAAALQSSAEVGTFASAAASATAALGTREFAMGTLVCAIAVAGWAILNAAFWHTAFQQQEKIDLAVSASSRRRLGVDVALIFVAYLLLTVPFKFFMSGMRNAYSPTLLLCLAYAVRLAISIGLLLGKGGTVDDIVHAVLLVRSRDGELKPALVVIAIGILFAAGDGFVSLALRYVDALSLEVFDQVRLIVTHVCLLAFFHRRSVSAKQQACLAVLCLGLFTKELGVDQDLEPEASSRRRYGYLLAILGAGSNGLALKILSERLVKRNVLSTELAHILACAAAFSLLLLLRLGHLDFVPVSVDALPPSSASGDRGLYCCAVVWMASIGFVSVLFLNRMSEEAFVSHGMAAVCLAAVVQWSLGHDFGFRESAGVFIVLLGIVAYSVVEAPAPTPSAPATASGARETTKSSLQQEAARASAAVEAFFTAVGERMQAAGSAAMPTIAQAGGAAKTSATPFLAAGSVPPSASRSTSGVAAEAARLSAGLGDGPIVDRAAALSAPSRSSAGGRTTIGGSSSSGSGASLIRATAASSAASSSNSAGANNASTSSASSSGGSGGAATASSGSASGAAAASSRSAGSISSGAAPAAGSTRSGSARRELESAATPITDDLDEAVGASASFRLQSEREILHHLDEQQMQQEQFVAAWGTSEDLQHQQHHHCDFNPQPEGGRPAATSSVSSTSSTSISITKVLLLKYEDVVSLGLLPQALLAACRPLPSLGGTSANSSGVRSLATVATGPAWRYSASLLGPCVLVGEGGQPASSRQQRRETPTLARLLANPDVGGYTAAIDSGWLAVARAGLVAALSVEALARPEWCIVVVDGLGDTARSALKFLRALCESRPLLIRLLDGSSANFAAFRQCLPNAVGVSWEEHSVHDPARALVDADVVLVTEDIPERKVPSGAALRPGALCIQLGKRVPASGPSADLLNLENVEGYDAVFDGCSIGGCDSERALALATASCCGVGAHSSTGDAAGGASTSNRSAVPRRGDLVGAWRRGWGGTGATRATWPSERVLVLCAADAGSSSGVAALETAVGLEVLTAARAQSVGATVALELPKQ